MIGVCSAGEYVGVKGQPANYQRQAGLAAEPAALMPACPLDAMGGSEMQWS